MTLFDVYVTLFVVEAVASTLGTIYLWRVHRRTRTALSLFFAALGTLLTVASAVVGVSAVFRLAGRLDVVGTMTPLTIPALLILGAATPGLALFLWWLGRHSPR